MSVMLAMLRMAAFWAMDERDEAGILGYECWLCCDVSMVVFPRVSL